MRLLPGRPLVTEVRINAEFFVVDVLYTVVERAGVERKRAGDVPHGRNDCRGHLVWDNRT